MNVFSIPPGLDFLRLLARGTMDMAAEKNIALQDFTVLLPNRRACRELQNCYLQETDGAALLLPRIAPIEDIDEEELLLQGAETGLAEPLPPLRRTALLARRIEEWQAQRGATLPPAAAWQLAGALGDLIDQIYIEELNAGDIAKLAPELYAQHWQEVLQFLSLIQDFWPRQLQELNTVDARQQKILRLKQQAEFYKSNPSPNPIIAAGSTGSIKASADLLCTIAGMKNGTVLLPGLDRYLEQEAWDKISVTHPQYYIKRLLEKMDVARGKVTVWPFVSLATPLSAREKLCGEIMRPAEATEKWQNLRLSREQVQNLHAIECPNPDSEARVIAVLMREALQDPGKTVSLVTPDRNLARRVAAEMRRWNVVADDSAGFSLDSTDCGRFLLLLARMIAEKFSPEILLSSLKHPSMTLGMDRAKLRQGAQNLEREWRKKRDFFFLPERGLAQYQSAGEEREILTALQNAVAPMQKLGKAKLGDWIRAHIQCAELCAAPGILWQGQDGEAAAEIFAELLQHENDLGEADAEDYAALLDLWFKQKTLRHKFEAHPRVKIWGLLEARLQQADRIILAGLNETVWPPAPDHDPWMSRPMRAEFGLPSRERRVGQSAHDFASLLAFPGEVFLTRAQRNTDGPAIASRWWVRMQILLQAAGLWEETTREAAPALALAAALDRPESEITIAPPAPTPPAAARPRKFSVTAVERWMRDPYAFYARHILHLERLPPLNEGLNAPARGTALHAALEEFIQIYDPAKHGDGASLLQDAIDRGLAPFRGDAQIEAIWRPRFMQMAQWFLETERARRAAIKQSWAERRGEISFPHQGATYTLSAKADRIDQLKDGGIRIIDYKTGQPPSQKQIEAGLSPQLPLEAAIYKEGGFDGLPQGPVNALEFWHLKAGRKGGSIDPVKGDIEQLADEALQGLKALIERYADAAQPYPAEPHGEKYARNSDYRHLSRAGEWGSGEES